MRFGPHCKIPIDIRRMLGLLRMNELEEDPEFKGRRLVPIDLSVDANPWDNIIKLSIRHVVVDIESKSVHQVLKEVSAEE